MKKMLQVSNEDGAIKKDDEAKRIKMKKESRYEPKSNDKDDLNEFLLIADELDKLRE